MHRSPNYPSNNHSPYRPPSRRLVRHPRGGLSRGITVLYAIAAGLFSSGIGVAQPTQPPDPFADIRPLTSSVPPVTAEEPWWSRHTLFRRELFFQTVTRDVTQSPHNQSTLFNRHSVGFEWLRRFQSRTSTVATCDLQARLVRRDGYIPVIQDMEGADRLPWSLEYHNAFCDLFNPLSHVLSPEDAAPFVGKLNARIGRFYLPLGLNLATDTHGTVLQLSNDQNLGFERDWYAGIWGALSPFISYDAYYLVGSGYDLRFDGQSGLAGFRLGTGSEVRNRWGLEAGIATLIGERLGPGHTRRAVTQTHDNVIKTSRFGPDLRYSLPTEVGSFILTNEASFGADNDHDTAIHLHQLGYLTPSRRFGANLQFRQQWTERLRSAVRKRDADDTGGVSRSLFSELTWYFSNDIANSRLHWINLSVEQILESSMRGSGSLVSIQYYRYW